jgi:diaminopimelate epimerase
MHVSFTKMQGAGNDFVVLDATRAPLALDTAALQRLGDRRFGVGADQILVVERSTTPGVDFRYRIFNGATGEEVEHCGNGARCFVRYVLDHGLSTQRTLRVETVNNLLELRMQDDGRVSVDMNRPVFDLPAVPFEATGLAPRERSGWALWPLALIPAEGRWMEVEAAVLSMGNPHAVLDIAQFAVDDVDAAPVATIGPRIERHPRFPRGVNVGFMQLVSRQRIRLRVHERSAGETLACGTGACAAVVAGIRQGRLDTGVEVETRGGLLRIDWAGGPQDPVLMTGPAETVFEGAIEL